MVQLASHENKRRKQTKNSLGERSSRVHRYGTRVHIRGKGGTRREEKKSEESVTRVRAKSENKAKKTNGLQKDRVHKRGHTRIPRQSRITQEKGRR